MKHTNMCVQAELSSKYHVGHKIAVAASSAEKWLKEKLTENSFQSFAKTYNEFAFRLWKLKEVQYTAVCINQPLPRLLGALPPAAEFPEFLAKDSGQRAMTAAIARSVIGTLGFARMAECTLEVQSTGGGLTGKGTKVWCHDDSFKYAARAGNALTSTLGDGETHEVLAWWTDPDKKSNAEVLGVGS